MIEPDNKNNVSQNIYDINENEKPIEEEKKGKVQFRDLVFYANTFLAVFSMAASNYHIENAPIKSYVLAQLAATNLIMMNLSLKKDEKREKKPFIKRIRKVIMALTIGLELHSAVVNIDALKQLTYGIYIEHNNPFEKDTNILRWVDEEKETICYEDAAADTLIDAIDKNIFFAENEKYWAMKLYPYFKDNTYINAHSVYKDLATTILSYRPEKLITKDGYRISGQYIEEKNEIHIFSPSINVQETLPHEVVHITGSLLPSQVLNEGMTSLIVTEYCFEGRTTDAYFFERAQIKILFELIGTEPVLKAYSNRNIDIIYEELAKIIGTVEEAKEFIESMEKLKTKEERYQNNNVLENYIEKIVRYVNSLKRTHEEKEKSWEWIQNFIPIGEEYTDKFYLYEDLFYRNVDRPLKMTLDDEKTVNYSK